MSIEHSFEEKFNIDIAKSDNKNKINCQSYRIEKEKTEHAIIIM